MADSPETRASLLVRIRDPRDERAWAEFAAIYAPLVRRLARVRGLQEADAADLSQDVLRAVAGAIERYDPDPKLGSFRAWLFTIARNLILNLLAAQRRHPRGSGDTDVNRLLEQQPAPDPEDTALFDAEYRRQLFRWAADRIRGEFRPTTWQAFWRTGVQDESPKGVAADLGLTLGALYVARSRVMARLRQVIEEVERS
jgi:RNA polymerase sigma-70 factor (ECF subfamily)